MAADKLVKAERQGDRVLIVREGKVILVLNNNEAMTLFNDLDHCISSRSADSKK